MDNFNKKFLKIKENIAKVVILTHFNGDIRKKITILYNLDKKNSIPIKPKTNVAV